MRPVIILAVVGVILLGAFASLGFSTELFNTFNTDGVVITHKDAKMAVEFNMPNVIGSWKSNADSETFTITGKYMESLTSWDVKEYRYKLYINGNDAAIQMDPTDGSWRKIPADLEGGKWYYLQPWTTTVKTTGDVQIKVVMEYKLRDFLFQMHEYTQESTSNLVPWDGANVLSGAGSITLPSNQLGPFEEGESVKITVQTGFTGGEGWVVKVYPPADRTDLTQTGQTIEELADDTSTQVTWTVPTGAFKAGTSNAWVAQLWNQYFDRADQVLLSIDAKERAPIIKAVVETNNQVSYSYAVSCNQTYAALDHITVYAWYGYAGSSMPSTIDTESWITWGQTYPLSNGAAQFVVEPKNMDGTIVVEIIAYDVDGRPSEPRYESFNVKDGSTEQNPNNILSQPFIMTNIVWLLIALAVIGMLGCLLVFGARGQWVSGITYGAIVAGVFGGLAYAAGSIPSIMFILG